MIHRKIMPVTTVVGAYYIKLLIKSTYDSNGTGLLTYASMNSSFDFAFRV